MTSRTRGLFRVELVGGEIRWATGEVDAGPDTLLDPSASLDHWLADDEPLHGVVASGEGGGPVLDIARVLAPIEQQEVWAAGVTYGQSRDGRVTESLADATVYEKVYLAERPELFHKAVAWRVRGPDEPITVREDSAWNVPEPELTLVISANGRIAGYVIGNDVSSRSIEGENPLYLPQAKIYDGACAIGPAIVPAEAIGPPFAIELRIRRLGSVVWSGATSTDRIRRPFEELVAYLMSAITFPVGSFMLTGTGIVPDASFTLLPADVVEIEIDGLGVLRNPVESRPVNVGGQRQRRC